MRELVEKIIEEKIAGTHLFPVELTIRQNRIEILLDGDCGVNIKECARLNSHLHRRLEEEGVDMGKYFVEISSPGIDRELKTTRDFKKNVGRKVQLKNNQNKILKGTLALVSEKYIVLMQQGAKQKKDILDISLVKEAKVVI